MKNKNRYNRILILMIVSEVMLIVFVLQWIRSQYGSEKELLVKDLTAFYLESQDDVIDTLLLHTYVNPVLSHEKTVTFSSDTLQYRKAEKNTLPLSKNNARITVTIDHGTDSGDLEADTARLRQLKEDIILRSVRMLVSHTEDSLRLKRPRMDIFIKPDTTLFIKHFHGMMKDAGMNFNIEWTRNKDSSVKGVPKKILFINPATPFILPEAVIKKYYGYLLGKISPQIIFGTVLILITGLAFVMACRNIRKNILINNLRNEFISNITHELKTPVATLSVALESLGKYRMSADPAVLDEYLTLASKETKRLEELIDRVLNHSTLEENRSMLNVTKINIVPLIKEITAIMSSRPDSNGLIEFLPGEENIIVEGDPLFLKGVLINLIDNSIKYCDTRPEIKIFADREKNYAVIRVNDNGPGIPQEYQKKVFEKFFRVPSGNIHNVKGYGLGLSFAALVTDLHKGSIKTVNLNPGCSFIIKLPLA